MTERRLNATAASLLGFLHERPMSGYELAATAAAVIGDFWTLTQSQVYRELTWMADDGLVTAGERGTRDRRPFAITEAGRDAFAQWVVLRTITLGYADDPTTPALVAAISPLRLVVLALLAAAVFGTVALVSASMTVRGARGATLRESAR